MNLNKHVLASLLCILAIGCNAQNPPATKASPGKTKSASRAAREVNRFEFVELELVKHPEDEKQLNHKYMGSLDGFDYVAVRTNRYRIPSDQLKLKQSFPLTEDSSKWIPVRIHFSHVKYQRD
jgi:hypothetical protein